MSTITNWDSKMPLPAPKPDLAFVRPPKGGLTYWVWRWRMWFEVTFVFSHLEPWEKALLLTISFIVTFLVTSAIFRYLPQHLMIMHGRAVYYLYGKQDGANGADYTTRLGQWISGSLSTIVTATKSSATPAGSGPGLMQEL